jgi:hypothetical protein
VDVEILEIVIKYVIKKYIGDLKGIDIFELAEAYLKM